MESREIILDIVSAAGAAALVAWIVWGVWRLARRAAVARRHPKPFLAADATVLGKRVERAGGGVRYLVEFRYDTGRTVTLAVPAALFGRFRAGQHEDLVTWRGAFRGFGDLLVPGAGRRRPRRPGP